MTKYYYSTQPFLAWCLNHYFYNQTHFAWVATPFYPYRQPNPRSSNPLRIYEDYYEPWKDQDEYSSYIVGKRLNVRKGVEANKQYLSTNLIRCLKSICDTIDLWFFYPIVYRVDIDHMVPENRLEITASGLQDSQEFRIRDLREEEFDILFADFEHESDVPELFLILWNREIDQHQALYILERRI